MSELQNTLIDEFQDADPPLPPPPLPLPPSPPPPPPPPLPPPPSYSSPSSPPPILPLLLFPPPPLSLSPPLFFPPPPPSSPPPFPPFSPLPSSLLSSFSPFFFLPPSFSYAQAYMDSHVNDKLASQIYWSRRQRGWTRPKSMLAGPEWPRNVCPLFFFFSPLFLLFFSSPSPLLPPLPFQN